MHLTIPKLKRKRHSLKMGETRKVFRLFKRLDDGSFIICGHVKKVRSPYGGARKRR